MQQVSGQRFLEMVTSFIDKHGDSVLDGTRTLKLNPKGIEYLSVRISHLEELDTLKEYAPVDYLRAYVSDLGDHRKLDNLRRFLAQINSLKLASSIAQGRDPTRINLTLFKNLTSLEISKCNLSAAAPKGLLELRPQITKLAVYDSASTLRDIFSGGALDVADQAPWPKLKTVSCRHNGILVMDDSLTLLPAVEMLDLSKNAFHSIERLQKCVMLTFVDLGFNKITSTFGINQVLGNIKVLVLRHNAISSTAGLDKLYSLEGLDLAHNVLSNLEEVRRLASLPCLGALWLEGNPVSFLEDYRVLTLALFPEENQLKLDGKAVTPKEHKAVQKLLAEEVKRVPQFPQTVPAVSPRSGSDERPATMPSSAGSSHPPSPSGLAVAPEDGFSDLRAAAERVLSQRKRKPVRRVADIADDLSTLDVGASASCGVEPLTGPSTLAEAVESARGGVASTSGASNEPRLSPSAAMKKKEWEELRSRVDQFEKEGGHAWLLILNEYLEGYGPNDNSNNMNGSSNSNNNRDSPGAVSGMAPSASSGRTTLQRGDSQKGLRPLERSDSLTSTDSEDGSEQTTPLPSTDTKAEDHANDENLLGRESSIETARGNVEEVEEATSSDKAVAAADMDPDSVEGLFRSYVRDFGSSESCVAYFRVDCLKLFATSEKERPIVLLFSEQKMYLLEERNSGDEPETEDDDLPKLRLLYSHVLSEITEVVIGMRMQLLRLDAGPVASYLLVTRSSGLGADIVDHLSMLSPQPAKPAKPANAPGIAFKSCEADQMRCLEKQVFGGQPPSVQVYVMLHQRITPGGPWEPRTLVLTQHSVVLCRENYRQLPSITSQAAGGAGVGTLPYYSPVGVKHIQDISRVVLGPESSGELLLAFSENVVDARLPASARRMQSWELRSCSGEAQHKLVPLLRAAWQQLRDPEELPIEQRT